MPAEYLDMAYITWQSMLQSIMPGWGLYVDQNAPSPSGYMPSSFAARGQSITSLIQTLGTQGRGSGVQAVPRSDGYMLVTVGMSAWTEYNGVLVDPLNVREQGASSGGDSDVAVTVDGQGVSSTVYDAGARFPGRQLLTSDGGNTKYVAQNALDTGKRTPGTLTLEANINLSDIRPGDVVPYIRASGRNAGGMLVRVLGVTVDESSLPATFGLTVQVIETAMLAPTNLQQGIYWPGVRGTGSRMVRRFQSS